MADVVSPLADALIDTLRATLSDTPHLMLARAVARIDAERAARETAEARVKVLEAALRPCIPALTTGSEACRETFCHKAAHYLDELAASAAAALKAREAGNG